MPEQRTYFVYILASKRNGTLYIGVTNDLTRRVLEHKDKAIKGFTSKYGVDKPHLSKITLSKNVLDSRE